MEISTDLSYINRNSPRISIHKVSKSAARVKKVLTAKLRTGSVVSSNNAVKVAKALVSCIQTVDESKVPKGAMFLEAEKFLENKAALDSKRYNALYTFVTKYAGSVVDEALLTKISKEVAGWEDGFRLGARLETWKGYWSWNLFYVADVSRIPTNKHKMFKVKLVGFAGPSIGEEYELIWNGGHITQIMGEIGAGKFVKKNPADLGGMHLTAYAGLDASDLVLEEIEAHSSQINYNKKLQQARKEVCSNFPQFTEQKLTCRECPVGREVCPLSRLDRSFGIVEDCVNGHRGYFRDMENNQACMSCVIQGNGYIRKEYKK